MASRRKEIFRGVKIYWINLDNLAKQSEDYVVMRYSYKIDSKMRKELKKLGREITPQHFSFSIKNAQFPTVLKELRNKGILQSKAVLDYDLKKVKTSLSKGKGKITLDLDLEHPTGWQLSNKQFLVMHKLKVRFIFRSDKFLKSLANLKY